MNYVAISHGRWGNLQANYQGRLKHDVISRFEDWCLRNEVIWARLFSDDTGEQIARFEGGELHSKYLK